MATGFQGYLYRASTLKPLVGIVVEVVNSTTMAVVTTATTNGSGKFSATGLTDAALFARPRIVGQDFVVLPDVTELYQPTIANFSNAQHDHGDADDGGVLTGAAIPWATPGIVLGTAAAAGAAGTAIRSDSTIAAFDVTAPTTSAVGDAAATGTVAFAARRDHTHGREAFAMNAVVLGTAAAAGAAATLIRSDATIAAFDTTAPVTQALGDAAATGSVAFAARRDHVHGIFAASAIDHGSISGLADDDHTQYALASGARAITGAQTFNVGIVPDADDGAYLGQSGTAFSDLFLASGAVINFAAGNYTATHSSGVLTLSGTLTATGLKAAGTATVEVSGGTHGSIELNSTDVAGATPYIDFHYGNTGNSDYASRLIATGNTQLKVEFAGASTGSISLAQGVLGPVVNDAVALGTSSVGFSDLFLASGAVVNFGAGNLTATHSSGVLTLSGDLYVERSASGAAVEVKVTNQSNTAVSHAWLHAISGGTSGGDPYVLFEVSGTTYWAAGIDNSDSDAFVVSANSSIGSNNALRIATTGAVTVPGSLTGADLIKSSHATAGIGYATGAGGTVTQITSKGTGVTLNKACGLITMHNAALAANTHVTFTLTNSAIALGDLLLLTHANVNFISKYSFQSRCVAGSAIIDVYNLTGGSLSEAVDIAFAVLKGVRA